MFQKYYWIFLWGVRLAIPRVRMCSLKKCCPFSQAVWPAIGNIMYVQWIYNIHYRIQKKCLIIFKLSKFFLIRQTEKKKSSSARNSMPDKKVLKNVKSYFIGLKSWDFCIKNLYQQNMHVFICIYLNYFTV